MKMKLGIVMLAALIGASLWAASSKVSSVVLIDGRTWTSSESDWITFNSRPLTGLFILVH